MSTTTVNKVHRFDKWAEFMEACRHGKKNPIVRNRSSREDEWAQTEPWSGAHSFEEALGWLSKGWTDGINRLKQFQKSIDPTLFDCVMPVKEYRPELRHQIAGGGIDVAAHLSGATPDVFITETVPHDDGQQIVKGNKMKTVYMNISNSSFTSEDAFFYRGAYTFSLVEHMENCGYSVELWVVNYVGDDSYNPGLLQKIYVKVKEFGEMFDTNKLAIALCSNYMLRRFIFSIQEQGDDEEIRKIQQGVYGIPIGWDGKTINTGRDVRLPDDISTPLFIGMVNVSDPKQMLEKFKEALYHHIYSEASGLVEDEDNTNE